MFDTNKVTKTAKPTIRGAVLTFSIARMTGGLYFSVLEQTKALKAEQVVNEVITLEGGWGERLTRAELDDWQPLNPRIFPCRWPRKLGYSPRILPALKESAPAMIHCHGLWHYHLLAASKHAGQQKIPWLVSPHGMLDDWALSSRGWKKRAAGWLYHDAAMRKASCIVALCGPEAEAVRQAGFKNQLCVIPNGVDLPAEAPGAPGVAGQPRMLVFLGRIAPKKGLLNLVRAWRDARMENPARAGEWVLGIAGNDEGGHEDELRKLVKELGLEQSIFFLGPQYGTAKTALLRGASAFILPSFSEGLPMGVLDAWACRLPVLLTPQCNLQEGVTAGAALQTQPNQEAVKRSLLQLFEMSPGQLAAMGAKGRELVEKFFTWPRVAGQIREVYDWLLGGGGAPACVQSDRLFACS